MRDISKHIHQRILVLDGAMGTMIQAAALTESQFRADLFANHDVNLTGCNDVLNLTQPEVIESIHSRYLEAGADIIETNTFNSNSISLGDYHLGDRVYELNLAGARIARRAADSFSTEQRPRFVAGSIGPTSKMCSMSPDVNAPEYRAVTFDQLVETYTEQIRGLVDGGVDILLIETVFDTLNCKAAIFAAMQLAENRGINVPIMISATIADSSGRILSGQTVEAFYNSISHAPLLSIGLNCSFGAEQMKQYIARLKRVASCAISAHPNAGLPNGMGGYDETPESMAEHIEGYLKEGLLNIVGGCCGTTPDYIAAIACVAKNYSPQVSQKFTPRTILSGLEPLEITPDANFINVGERTNVAGSARFAKMIREGRYADALSVARGQVEDGAQIIDICMDDGMIDGPSAIIEFINRIAAEPDIARVPIMIDSSSWEVIEAALKCTQGKSIVNSISLKEGESEFLRRAAMLRKYGAAAVVMLFDEQGQATTFDRKIEIADRAYKLLTSNGFPAEDIIFDPNILAIATGISQHDSYGLDYIRACRWIKKNCPRVKISGGVSNLSFSFRGNNPIREAMHSVFLYHAIEAGMDMGIVNPAMLQIYDEIDPELLAVVEDAVLNRRADATERLVEKAAEVKAQHSQSKEETKSDLWRTLSVEERIAHSMIKGIDQFIEQDTLEALNLTDSPLAVIDRMLMAAMNQIGELFGSGKMFLPQVVKSARVMKRSVEVLAPYIEQENISTDRNSTPSVVLATVKGDVHDIGKNIVSVVMACNGYKMLDLGVMVSPEEIVNRVQESKAAAIGLSGLITPSLEEMIRTVELLEQRGVDVPVMIGGATTSALHTAVKIAPKYSGVVIQVRDAADNVRVMAQLCSENRQQFIAQIKAEQEQLRREYLGENVKLRTLEEARKRGHRAKHQPVVPARLGVTEYKNYPIREVVDSINWAFFFKAWGISGRLPEIFDHPQRGVEARKVYADAQAMLEQIIADNLLTLNGVVGIFPAHSSGDDIVVYPKDCKCCKVILPQLRSQNVEDDENLSLADFLLPAGCDDYIGLFVVTAGVGLDAMIEGYRAKGDDYSAIMAELVADRLAEAFAEHLHNLVARELWGYAKDDKIGIRPAVGYPCCPNHQLKRDIFQMLEVERRTGIRLVDDNCMMTPTASVSGMIFASEDSRYFSVGKIDDVQLEDYVTRCNTTTQKMKKMLAHNIK